MTKRTALYRLVDEALAESGYSIASYVATSREHKGWSDNEIANVIWRYATLSVPVSQRTIRRWIADLERAS